MADDCIKLFVLTISIVCCWQGKGEAFKATTSAGYQFFVAVSKNEFPVDPCAYLTIACIDLIGDVTVHMPTRLDVKDSNYDIQTSRVDRQTGLEIPIPQSLSMKKTGKGKSIIIKASVRVTVLLLVQGQSASADIAMIPPLDAYTEEYVVVSQPGPSWLLILAGDSPTDVSIQWANSGQDYNIKNCVDGSPCKKGGKNTLHLDKSTFFYMYTDERTNTASRKDLTGTKLSGSKSFTAMVGHDPLQGSVRNGDFTMASVRPTQNWGYLYVAFNTFPFRCVKLVVTALQAPTDFSVYSKESTKGTKYTIKKERGSIEITLDLEKANSFHLVDAEKPVHVLVTSHHCSIDQPFMVNLVPNELFGNKVFFRSPSYVRLDPEWLVTIIAPTKTAKDIVINGVSYDSAKWIEVPGTKAKKTKLAFSGLTVSINSRTVVIVNVASTARFGAYLHFNGYMDAMVTELASDYKTIQKTDKCTKSGQTLGDLLDNDCDGLVDEEIENKLDDDGDGSIDEDNTEKRENGSWAAWMPWFCAADCKSYGYETRFRECSNPLPTHGGLICPGHHSEVGKTCHAKKDATCPYECPRGFFALTCTAKCPENCAGGVCGRLDGSCQECEGGTQLAPYCSVTGKYADSAEEGGPGFLASYWYIFLLVPIIIAVAYIVWTMRGRKSHHDEEALAAKEMAMEETRHESVEPVEQAD